MLRKVIKTKKLQNPKALFTSVMSFFGMCHMSLHLLFCVCLSQGAFWGLTTGLVVGLIRMILEFYYGTPSCGQPDLRPAVVAKVHYLYFALILLAFTFIVVVAVSLATAPIAKEHVRNMSYILSGQLNQRQLYLVIRL